MTIQKCPEDGLVYACPNCDAGGKVYRRDDDDPPCRCYECGHEFHQPVTRPTKDTIPEPPSGADHPDIPDFVREAVENEQQP